MLKTVGPVLAADTFCFLVSFATHQHTYQQLDRKVLPKAAGRLEDRKGGSRLKDRKGGKAGVGVMSREEKVSTLENS